MQPFSRCARYAWHRRYRTEWLAVRLCGRHSGLERFHQDQGASTAALVALAAHGRQIRHRGRAESAFLDEVIERLRGKAEQLGRARTSGLVLAICINLAPIPWFSYLPSTHTQASSALPASG